MSTVTDRWTGATPPGPARHLAAERQRLGGLRWDRFAAEQLGATVGAEIIGVDLTGDLDDGLIDELRRALTEYKVIFFRDQPLTPERHVAFARRFGVLEIHPFLAGNDSVPELVRFEKSADAVGYENLWHHDVTWREIPSMGAVLHAVKVPPVGGDTLFADMYAAYDGLPGTVRTQIDELDAVHDFIHAFGRDVADDQRQEMRSRYPQVIHPVAPRHDVTGRRFLYVNGVFTDSIVGLDSDESESLLAYLFRQTTRPEYQCRFRWADHSVAFWDNRAVQHYASSDYWPEVRIMERASIVGDRPAR